MSARVSKSFEEKTRIHLISWNCMPCQIEFYILILSAHSFIWNLVIQHTQIPVTATEILALLVKTFLTGATKNINDGSFCFASF